MEKKIKAKDKPETLFLSPELTNYLLSALTRIEEIDTGNRYAQLAGQLKQTILRFSKKKKKIGRSIETNHPAVLEKGTEKGG